MTAVKNSIIVVIAHLRMIHFIACAFVSFIFSAWLRKLLQGTVFLFHTVSLQFFLTMNLITYNHGRWEKYFLYIKIGVHPGNFSVKSKISQEVSRSLTAGPICTILDPLQTIFPCTQVDDTYLSNLANHASGNNPSHSHTELSVNPICKACIRRKPI